MKPDVLDVLESAYDVDSRDQAWLDQTAKVIYDQIGAGQGMVAYTFSVGDDFRVRPGHHTGVDAPPGLAEQTVATLPLLPPEYVKSACLWPGPLCSTVSHCGDEAARAIARAMLPDRDILVITGIDPTRHGISFGIHLSRVTPPDRRVQDVWGRVAVHLASAYRVRRRFAAGEDRRIDAADAVLAPDGRTLHARDDAKLKDARETLKAAVRTIDRARSRKKDTESALASWKGLVSARWTLLDHVESDGKRYVVARRNEATARGFESLSTRERQAAGFAALGHTNKVIAYELGIAASTVSVLLLRAARKLGATDRPDMIRRFREGRENGPPDERPPAGARPFEK